MIDKDKEQEEKLSPESKDGAASFSPNTEEVKLPIDTEK